jgi:hypothetical protein
MKTSTLIVTGLLLAGNLSWGTSTVKADEMISKVAADSVSYCHMKFPPISEASLSSDQPVLDEAAGNVIDFYGSCDHDPLGNAEVEAQRRALSATGD